MGFRRAVSLFALMAAFALMTASCFGQAAGGVAGISGIVKDASGAAVPHAKVEISSASRGVVRTLETNDSGAFAAPALLPGPGYKVTVTAAGFATYEAKDLDLEVGQNMNLTVAMAVGQTTTSVEVNAAAQLLEDTKSDVSQVVNTRDIMELPINGRRVDSFVLNTAGVTNDATFGLLTFRGVAGNNSFLLDGNDNTEQFYDENAGRTRIQSQMSADAVEEFQVVSTNFSAEYGRAMGGVVNTVTKSGTNAIHGSAFYFLRSTGFVAHDPFSAFNPPEHRVQTGGTVGGAIIKNKLFYFLSADITRRNFPIVDSLVKAGFVNTSTQTWVGCGAPASTAQCNAINALLPRFFSQTPRTADNDLYFGRLDYHFNDKNAFSVSFNFLRWLSPEGIQTGISSTSGAGINDNGDDSVAVRNGKATWTFVPNGRWVNVFRYGLDTDRQADVFDSLNITPALGYLSVAVAGVQVGNALTYLPRVEPMETRNEFADDLSWAKGKHLIKFGATVEHVQEDISYLSGRFGSYSYSTVTNFALDYTGNTGAKNYSSFSQTFGNPIVDYPIKDVGFYVQDQWKVTDRLTVTLGARYEHTIAPAPPAANPLFPLTGASLHTGALDLMPRIGFAYRLNDKTVIRGGAGTFYARLVGGLLDDVLTGNGLYQVSDNLSNAALIAQGPVFPNALSGPLTGLTQGASTLDVLSPKLKTPYSEQATIAVERQIGKDMVLTRSPALAARRQGCRGTYRSTFGKVCHDPVRRMATWKPGGGAARRRHRSVRLGRAGALVHQVHERERRCAVDEHGANDRVRRHRREDAGQAHVPDRGGLPRHPERQPHRRQRQRQLRVHRVVHRLGLWRLPARAAAAGDKAVRPRPRTVPIAFVGSLLQRRLADDLQGDVERRAATGIYSPVSEASNRLATLDTNPGFTKAMPVLAGTAGPSLRRAARFDRPAVRARVCAAGRRRLAHR